MRTKTIRKLLNLLFVAILLAGTTLSLGGNASAAPAPATGTSSGELWVDVYESSLRADGERRIIPEQYRTLSLDVNGLHALLQQAPLEFSAEAQQREVVIPLPLPDGGYGRFRFVESPIMAPELGAKFPEIKTYLGRGLDDLTATVRFDWTQVGFHAMILSSNGTVFIDPYSWGDIRYYISYFERDYTYTGAPFEELGPLGDPEAIQELAQQVAAEKVASGDQLRTYRAAVAATGEYTTFHGGTVPLGMAAIVTAMNRVNQIYERDVAVRMVLVANNNLVVYTNGATDPYTNNNGPVMLGENQANLDAVIGDANYDIGHVFSTGGGGIATLGVPCVTGSKARGVTGLPTPIGDPFYIDYVAHEMGHQYNATHTFNGNTGSCAGNRTASTAYEPGSGTTIMGYAGICPPQDIQSNSDADFHGASYDQIIAYTQLGAGNTCAATTATGNSAPTVNAGTGGFSIPINTPFTLVGSASDPDSDPMTYDWEEFDLGAAGHPDSPVGDAPIFRSFLPVSTPERTFPQISDIVNNVHTIGELLPSYARNLTFRLTARDNHVSPSAGGVGFDTIAFNVEGAAGPFLVTAPNTAVTWTAGSAETVTWDVAGTTAAPVSCANVDIQLSRDGGYTYPVTLLSSTPNDGSQTVVVPIDPLNQTTTARIKAACSNNIFFDISNVNFTVNVPACSNNITVTSSADSGAGTLRQAIADLCGGGVIDFNGNHSIYLDSQLNVTETVTIEGGMNNVVVSGDSGDDGSANVRVFYIDASGALTLTHMNVVSGTNPAGGGGAYVVSGGALTVLNSAFTGNSTSYVGGGITNNGTLTVANSVFAGNTASEGGGIYTDGILTIQDSAFTGNSASNGGGGILNWGTLTVTNSTFAGNTTTNVGGGIANIGTATLLNSTLSANSALAGGGVYVQAPGAFSLENTIVAGNSATGSGPDLAGTIISNDYNLIQDLSGATITPQPNDITGGPALLSALGAYGGATQTMALLPNSPAIDAGNAGSCPANDQRGVARVGVCDIGAFESRGFNLSYTSGSGQSTLINTAFANPLALAVSSGFSEPVDGGQVVFTAPSSGASLATTPLTATISSGSASQPVSANSTAGGYSVSADLLGNLGSAVNYNLTNLAPEIDVLGLGISIPNGDDIPSTSDDTDFGSTPWGTPVTHTFTISNTGDGDLILGGTPAVTLTVGTHFSVTVQPASPVLSDTTTTFKVAFEPTAVGYFTDTVTITNNDPDENPYTFVIGGTGVKASTTTTITADIPDPSVVNQSYMVTASVTSTVGTPTGTVDVDDGDGNTCQITLAGGAGSCSLTSTSAGAKTLTADYNGDANFNASSDAESHTVIAPDIVVRGKGQVIANGDNTPTPADDTDFGSMTAVGGAMAIHTFTIENTGSADLNLTGTPRVALAVGGPFSVSAQPGGTVGINDSTSFTIVFDPTTPGIFVDTVTIDNDDPDENPYTFTIQGIGLSGGGKAPDAPVILTPAEGELTDAEQRNNPTFSGTAQPGATVTVMEEGTAMDGEALVEGGAVLCTALADASGDWSCTSEVMLASGEHTIMATATDTQGNTSLPAMRSFMVPYFNNLPAVFK